MVDTKALTDESNSAVETESPSLLAKYMEYHAYTCCARPERRQNEYIHLFVLEHPSWVL